FFGEIFFTIAPCVCLSGPAPTPWYHGPSRHPSGPWSQNSQGNGPEISWASESSHAPRRDRSEVFLVERSDEVENEQVRILVMLEIERGHRVAIGVDDIEDHVLARAVDRDRGDLRLAEARGVGVAAVQVRLGQRAVVRVRDFLHAVEQSARGVVLPGE